MSRLRTIADVLAQLQRPSTPRLDAPAYTGEAKQAPVGLAVASMKDHFTDEGWQIFAGLEQSGYKLVGRHLPRNETDVAKILKNLDPGTVVLQDKREHDVLPRDFRDPGARFTKVEALADGKRFVLTILKDTQQRPEYHRQSAAEIGCHAWVIYYHPDIVTHLAPYVRPEHLVRTYHSLDASLVPAYSAERRGCLLSGAISSAYPLRQRLFREAGVLPETTVLHHPGYHRNGCGTPDYLKDLSKYKVAICTSSIFGYALRKIPEAVACGCIVVTDLPTDEVLPEIDSALVRVPPDMPTKHLASLLRELYAGYDAERARYFAEQSKWYDYRASGMRLAQDIEALRSKYP